MVCLVWVWCAPVLHAAPVSGFFPVTPGAEWRFAVGGTETVRRVDASTQPLHGAAASGFRTAAGGQFQDRQWWSTSLGLRLHRIDHDEAAVPGGIRFEEPLVYLPADIAVGTSQNSTVRFARVTAGTTTAASWGGQVEIGVQVEASETLTLAAGVFETLRVSVTELWFEGGQFTYFGTSWFWLAPGVGIVRFADDSGSLDLKTYSLSPTPPVAVAPVITVPPAGATVAPGTAVTFSVTATGTAPLAYQWRKDGVTVSGATGPSLGLAAVTVADAGAYTVEVSNPAGRVTSAAAVLVVQGGGGGGGTGERPSITRVQRTQAGELEVTFQAANGRTWTFESSDDLVLWNPVAGVTADGSGSRRLGAAGAGSRFFRMREGLAGPAVLTLPEPGKLYPEGTRLGGELFGVEFAIPPKWKGGQRVGSAMLLFGSDTEPGLILGILGFSGTLNALLNDPSLRNGFESDMGDGTKLMYAPVRPIAAVGANRVSATYLAVAADGRRIAFNLEILVHPSGGVLGFGALTLEAGMPALQEHLMAFVNTARLTPRATLPELVSALQGRSFRWESAGNEWYRGDWQSSISSASWGESFAFFCADGSFELNRESTSYITSRDSSGWSSQYMSLSTSSTTKEYGQFTVVRSPQYGDLMLIATLSGYQAAPIRLNPDGSLLVGDNRLTPHQRFTCPGD